MARAPWQQWFDRHGLKLAENDASFAIVTLNESVVRKAIAELLDQMDQHNKQHW